MCDFFHGQDLQDHFSVVYKCGFMSVTNFIKNYDDMCLTHA